MGGTYWSVRLPYVDCPLPGGNAKNRPPAVDFDRRRLISAVGSRLREKSIVGGRLREKSTSRLDFAGYRFDENDRKSANLRLQFARFPGPRSFGGPRGRQH
ncbi:hypothetical protein GW17_00051220 [Ensete ventricosum]|nr:hypothetical protein GW17_00051220 [Ensete ventricosum]